MMIRNIHKAIIALLLIGLPSVSFAKRYDVTLPEVASCLETAQPGDRIYIKDGQYKDMQLKWIGKGTEKSPITIEALNPGKVKVEGGSTLRIAGEWLSVSGLHFTDGYAPKGSVIEFRNGQELANHCRLTNCVIDKFNPSRRDQAYSYILLYGRHNRVDHCSLTGKLNLGLHRSNVRTSYSQSPYLKNCKLAGKFLHALFRHRSSHTRVFLQSSYGQSGDDFPDNVRR